MFGREIGRSVGQSSYHYVRMTGFYMLQYALVTKCHTGGDAVGNSFLEVHQGELYVDLQILDIYTAQTNPFTRTYNVFHITISGNYCKCYMDIQFVTDVNLKCSKCEKYVPMAMLCTCVTCIV